MEEHNSASAPVIGVDIGGTKVRVGLMVGETVVGVMEEPTPLAGGHAVMVVASDLCEKLAETHAVQPKAVGLGATGYIDPKQGVVLQSTGNIADWAGTNLKTPLEERLGVGVAIANDVNAFAFGEMTNGAGRGYDSALCITVGTGVGGAIVIDGEIWTGASYSSGEVGYLFGGRDEYDEPVILEYLTGGRAMERAYQKRQGLEIRLSLREVARLALQEQDDTAREVIEEGATLLGQVIGSTLTFLDPHVCIIGGGVPEIGALWWEPFIREMEAVPLRSNASAPIVRAELGTDAVMLGAAALARQLIS